MLFVLIVLLACVASPVSTSALPLGDNDFCAGLTNGTCGVGEGDRDPGSCQAGVVCATDSGPTQNEREDAELIAREVEWL